MTETHRPLAAALWMSGSIVAFSAMAVAGRSISGIHDTFEIMTWRSLIGFVIVVSIALISGRLNEVRTDALGRHFLRNLAHFSGQNLWFWSLTMIPLAQVFALEFTSPIWVILLAPLFLGEKLTRAKLVAAALGFTGTLIVARPDFSHIDPGVAAAAGAAICFATTTIFTKKLTRHEGIVSILFWLTGMQLVMGLISAGYDGDLALPTAKSLPWLVLIGLAGLTAHFCLTKALSLAPASTVVPIDFIRLPVAASLGWLIYHEALEPPVLIGAAFILAGIWINLHFGNYASKTQKSAQ